MTRGFLLVFLLLLSGLSVYSQGLDLTYKKRGKVLYSDVVLSHPSVIKVVLDGRSTPEIQRMFKKYKINRGAAMLLGFAGGLGMAYPVIGSIGGDKFNAGLFAGGAGAFGAAILFYSSSNKALKKTVDLYNAQGVPLSFSPLIEQRNGLTHVGLRIDF